ncbi:N-formylglutamate amidohydrolase [Rubripirellula tenax]|uniref:N-formylglutamate amidohydrolase n=1 Tax=Rubripirellula tenax TaxID=2528015 RepID=A0A5C6FEC7_9BACT|nr:N-formylglutamate amidohydrolase [Rubripirellula tenax]
MTAAIAAEGLAVHLSVHTFTPRFRGTRRAVDIGILFDPDRKNEAAIANAWCKDLATRLPRMRIAANQPYLGTDDGLTTWIRTKFAAPEYVGIEIEIANSIAKKSKGSQHKLLTELATTIGNPTWTHDSARGA